MRARLLAGVAAICMVGAAPAARAAVTATVVCGGPGAPVSRKIASLPPTIGFHQLTLQGNCTENIAVPHGLGLVLIGAPGATLTGANTASPIIYVEGRLILKHLKIHSATHSDGAALSLVDGTLNMFDTSVTVPNYANAILGDFGSKISVWNTALSGGDAAAVQVTTGSVLTLVTDKTQPGPATSITGAKGKGVGCFTSSVVLWSPNGGSVTIQGSGQEGLHAQNCEVRADAASYASPAFHFMANGAASNGGNIYLAESQARLQGISLAGSKSFAIQVDAGSTVDIVASVSKGNAKGFGVFQGSSLSFSNWAGANRVADAAPQFQCWNGGRVHVAAGAVVPTPSAQANCVTVDGP